MPDTPTVEPQAGETDAPPIAQAAIVTKTAETQAVDAQESISLEEARKLRSEANNLRKRMKAYEEAEQQARDAQLSEAERAKKQAADLQSKHEAYVKQTQDRLIRYEIERQASALGIIDPDAAARLLDRADLEYDDDGNPTNAEKLLHKLLKHKPWLAPKPADPAPETPATPAQTAHATQAPAVPAMNPGRSSIAAPNAAPPGTIPQWGELLKRSY